MHCENTFAKQNPRRRISTRRSSPPTYAALHLQPNIYNITHFIEDNVKGTNILNTEVYGIQKNVIRLKMILFVL